jgi:hypothetical protein
MNIEKLKLAEAHFLQMYPKGFADPALELISKRHRVDAMSDFTQAAFAKKQFKNERQILDDLIRTVSRSSMVSMFEKPKFRDHINALSKTDQSSVAAALKKLLHGNQEKGFNELLDILSDGKIARWSLMTIALVYFNSQTEVLVKPTTAKGIINLLELDLSYKPRPYWEFYVGYRDAINDIKAAIDPSLRPNNAAITGFLMMSLGL